MLCYSGRKFFPNGSPAPQRAARRSLSAGLLRALPPLDETNSGARLRQRWRRYGPLRVASAPARARAHDFERMPLHFQTSQHNPLYAVSLPPFLILPFVCSGGSRSNWRSKTVGGMHFCCFFLRSVVFVFFISSGPWCLSHTGGNRCSRCLLFLLLFYGGDLVGGPQLVSVCAARKRYRALRARTAETRYAIRKIDFGVPFSEEITIARLS